MLKTLSVSDQELEFTVLKCILMRKDFHNYLFKLTEDDFYSHRMQDLFTYMASVVSEDGELEFSLLPGKFKTDRFYLPLVTQVPITSYFKKYFKKLKDLSNKRRLQRIAHDINIHIQEEKDAKDIKDIISYELSELYKYDEKLSSQNEEVDAEFQERMIDKSIPFIESGFTDIDDCIGGFMPSTFTVIAGAPTIGKTTLVLNMVNHVCKKLKKKVLFVSLEMSYIQLQAKLISSLTAVNSRKLINPRMRLSQDDLNKVNNGRKIIEEYNLYRMGDKETTTGTIEDEIRTIGDIDIVFIDYLQLLKPKYYINSRYDRITQVSNELKRLSRRYNIPIVCIASINRAASTRNTKRPQLSDLRDSGNIEYDVDTALLLHRESEVREHNPNKDKEMDAFLHEAEIHVAKNRFGESDMLIKLWWEPEYSRFRNVARVEPEPEQGEMEFLRKDIY
jgi:replicative DNA helicase